VGWPSEFAPSNCGHSAQACSSSSQTQRLYPGKFQRIPVMVSIGRNMTSDYYMILETTKCLLTFVMSLPCNCLYAFVHLTLRGFLFILKFLWHFDRQKRKIWQEELPNHSYRVPTRYKIETTKFTLKARKAYALPYIALKYSCKTIFAINTLTV